MLASLRRAALGSCTVLQSPIHNVEHFIPRRGLPGPDFKLPRRLMDEHFYSRNNFSPFLLSKLEQASLTWIVNHIENVLGFDFVGIEWRIAVISHPHRGRVNDDIESVLFQIGFF